MANSVKSVLGQTITDVGEAVIEPTLDEVGKAIESGTQLVIGQTPSQPQNALSPQKVAQRREGEEKRKQWALRVIDWYKKIDEAKKRVMDQKTNQQNIHEQKEEQETKVKQFKIVEKKQQSLSVAQIAERKSEIKKGVGG